MNCREENIDSLRTLCALLVIILHVCATYLIANFTVFNVAFFTASSIQVFTRVAVPVFVLISGRYVLSNWDGKSLSSFYKKRLPKVMIPFISWSIIYIFWRIFVEKSGTFISIINDTLNGVPYIHLWFFYMIIGLYVVTPGIYKIKNKFSVKGFRNLGFALLIVASISEFIQGVFSFKYIPVFYFVDYLGYYITGYTLKDYKSKINPKIFLYIYIILGILRGILASLFQMKGSQLWMYMHTASNPLAIPAAIFLYLFFSNLKLKKYRLASISKYTLGIYVIHMIFLSNITYFTQNTLTGIVFIDIILYVIIIFSLSLFTIKLFWKWEWTRKIIQ